jgi:phosphoglycerate transport regulatory protein PgtC
VMITYRLDDLRGAVEAIQGAEAKLAGKSNGDAQKLIDEARALVAAVPITAQKASERDFNAIFKKKRKKASTKVTGRQAEIEQQWDSEVKANYAKAKELAEKAASMM